MFTVFRMKHFLILDYLIKRWLDLFFSSGSRCLPSKTNDFASHSNSPPISTHPYHSITSQPVRSPKEHEPKWPIHISIMICHITNPSRVLSYSSQYISSSPHWPAYHFLFLNTMFFLQSINLTHDQSLYQLRYFFIACSCRPFWWNLSRTVKFKFSITFRTWRIMGKLSEFCRCCKIFVCIVLLVFD